MVQWRNYEEKRLSLVRMEREGEEGRGSGHHYP
jgi:hypothetical protein